MKKQTLFLRALNNIELLLSGLGLVVIVTVPAVLRPEPSDWWAVTAITAIVVGVLHGGIFWLIRRRQRQARAAAIAQIREMLGDVVKNQLAIISLNAQLSGAQSRHQQRIETSVKRIEEALTHISEESLAQWQARYEEDASTTQAAPAN
ncbi:hypothetical protein VZO05_07465 [Aggregatilineales bacterium SYSU G02658]